MTERKSVWWQNNPAPLVVDYAKNVCDVAILPIGAIEQHGPHCPTPSQPANAGYNKFIIISAHGQVSFTIVAVHKLGIEGHFVLSLHWYDFLRDDKDVLEDYMWHADEAETSVALYLYPELVDMSLAAPGEGTPLIDPKWKIAPGAAAKPGQMYHFEGTFARPEKHEIAEGGNGVVGDPTKATLEKGEILVTRVVDHISELVAEIRETYPLGVKPETN